MKANPDESFCCFVCPVKCLILIALCSEAFTFDHTPYVTCFLIFMQVCEFDGNEHSLFKYLVPSNLCCALLPITHLCKLYVDGLWVTYCKLPDKGT